MNTMWELLLTLSLFAQAESLVSAPDRLAPSAQACLESVCGPADTNWSNSTFKNRRGGRDQNVIALWEKDLRPRLQQILNQREQAWIGIAQAIPGLLQKAEAVELTETARVMLARWKLSAVLANEGAMVVKRSSIKKIYEVDQSALHALFEIRPQEERRALQMMAQWTANLMNETSMMRVFAGEDPLAARLRAKYPGTDPLEAQKKDAASLIRKAQSQREIFIRDLGESIYSSSVIDLFDRVAKGFDLSESEAREYVQNSLEIESTDRLFSNQENYRLLLMVPLDITSELAKAKGKIDELSVTDQRERIRQALTDLSKTCEGQLHASLAANASSLRYRKMAEIAEGVRTAAQTVASRLTSAEGQTSLQARLATIRFSYPSTNEERVRQVQSSFSREEESARQQLELAMSGADDRDQKLLFRLASLNYREINDDFDKKSPIRWACEHLPVEGISDYTAPASGRISLGWFGSNYPQAGVSIVAHEMGHVVSLELRKQKKSSTGVFAFTDSYNCVAARNPYALKELPIGKDGFKMTNWSEEDWADHFSSMVMEELKKTGSPFWSAKNKGCALLDQNEGVYDASLDPSMKDRHSKPFLRLLMIANDRGSVTPECQPFIDDFKRDDRQLKCH